MFTTNYYTNHVTMTLRVRETLVVLTLHVHVLQFWLIFSFSTSAVPCIVEFTGHLLSDDMLLAIREWE